ncbi:hypothetical protein [Pedobacter mucosus]|uniref:hypothetical protein n=1 Tax=Pedobacter mucosus TaxID=2895286 RepID=UPI001EE437DA|nr:hypothetical protein [Pedobacter mucosus]UKT62738.1 hypothetical protein LOK61_13305 [Pedobacter mucosus]
MKKISTYNALKLIQDRKVLDLPDIVVREGSGFTRIENLGYIKIIREINSNLATLTESGLEYISKYEISPKVLKLKT